MPDPGTAPRSPKPGPAVGRLPGHGRRGLHDHTTAPTAPTRTPPVGPEHVRRALALVDAHTTEMSDHILTVPLSYYRDPTLADRERSLCRRTPLALAPTAQLPNPQRLRRP